MRIVDWSVDGWLHHPTGSAPPDSPLAPRRTRVLSGAFVFTLGAGNDDVRQDPEHLFTGEEFALTLRSFTSGYDIWHPPTRVICHRNRHGRHVRHFTLDPH